MRSWPWVVKFISLPRRVFSIKSRTHLDIATSLSPVDLLIRRHASEHQLPSPDPRHGTMESPNSYVRIEEVIFTVPIITDREKFESMDMRTFTYQNREMNPDLSINVFTNNLERLFKAMMLQLDNPQTFYSEQVRANFSREHTKLVEGAQEKVCIDFAELYSFSQEPINPNECELTLNWKWEQSGSWTACLQELAFQFLLDYKNIMKRVGNCISYGANFGWSKWTDARSTKATRRRGTGLQTWTSSPWVFHEWPP